MLVNKTKKCSRQTVIISVRITQGAFKFCRLQFRKSDALDFLQFLYKITLSLSWRRPLSYRNQSIDLLRKWMDWFLCDNDLRHEGVKPKSYWFTWSALKNCHNHFMIINYSFFDSKIFLEIWRFVCQKQISRLMD